MGSSGEKSAKKAKKEKKDTPKSSKKRDRDGLPVPSSASKGGEGDDDEKQNPVCAIASPLADGKLTKKLLKVVKKGKQMNKSGVRLNSNKSGEGSKRSSSNSKRRKKDCASSRGTYRQSMSSRVPMLCEEAGVQYVYVHSKEQLGAAGMTKRPTSVMLVLPKAVKGSTKMGKDDEKEFEEMYKSVYSKVKGMHEK
ncbi:unnamed protein product [Bathycoccus prasinos]